MSTKSKNVVTAPGADQPENSPQPNGAEALLVPLISALDAVRAIQAPIDQNKAKNAALEAEERELLGELDERIRQSESSALIGSKVDSLLPTATLMSLRPHVEQLLAKKFAPTKLDEQELAKALMLAKGVFYGHAQSLKARLYEYWLRRARAHVANALGDNPAHDAPGVDREAMAHSNPEVRWLNGRLTIRMQLANGFNIYDDHVAELEELLQLFREEVSRINPDELPDARKAKPLPPIDTRPITARMVPGHRIATWDGLSGPTVDPQGDIARGHTSAREFRFDAQQAQGKRKVRIVDAHGGSHLEPA
jgi:hypothetical protein